MRREVIQNAEPEDMGRREVGLIITASRDLAIEKTLCRSQNTKR
jgi:hypothetical protein